MSVENKEGLIQQLQAHRHQIKAYGVKQLGLFGSFARDKAIHAGSDVDLLVEFDAGQKTYDNFMGLSFYLEGLLDRKVELLTKESLSRHMAPYILNEVEHVDI